MVLFFETLRLKEDSASANPVTQYGESSNSFTFFTVPKRDTEVEYNLLVCHFIAGKAFKVEGEVQEYTTPRRVFCFDNTLAELL